MNISSPYPGLRPFEYDEAHLFFGRETQVEDMLARLEEQRFLAVVGSSGCGKSSLVRAGLIPALEQGFLSDAEPNWRIAVMRPGNSPFNNLTKALMEPSALGRERGHKPSAEAILQATLRRGPLGLLEAVEETHLPDKENEGTNLLLVVDQFEEIFRYCKQSKSSNEADAFVALLLASAEQFRQSSVPIYVIITMRSDFIGDCARFSGLPERINDSQFLTPRPTRDQYRAAIVEPARLQGGDLSESLVNQLLNDLQGEPDQLPVLQHALMRMWTTASVDISKPVLSHDNYKIAGNLSGALSQHCDEILQSLDTSQKEIAQVLFRALCERSSAQRDIRRPVTLNEVAAIAGVSVDVAGYVADAFRGAERNFITPPLPKPLDRNTILDISHESLIRHWQTLNSWVKEETESMRQYLRIEDAAVRHKQESAELWHGADLANALSWRDKEKPTEAWAQRYGNAYGLAMTFLDESETEEEQKQLKAEKKKWKQLIRLKQIVTVVITLLLLAVGFGIYAYQQGLIAEEARVDADKQTQKALKSISRYLSAKSETESNKDEPDRNLAALLSIEAMKTIFLPAAETSLRKVIAPFGNSKSLNGHHDRVNHIVYSLDGQWLASASSDKTILLWPQSTDGEEVKVFNYSATKIAFDPKSKWLVAIGDGDKKIHAWSLTNKSNPPILFEGHQETVIDFSFSPNGQWLVSTSKDKTVRVWSLHNTAFKMELEQNNKKRITSFAFSPDSEWLTTASADGHIYQWFIKDNVPQLKFETKIDKSISKLTYSPDGRWMVGQSQNNKVALWAVEADKIELRSEKQVGSLIRNFAFSPNNKLLVSWGSDRDRKENIHIWPVALWSKNQDNFQPCILDGFLSRTSNVSFSQDSKVLASWGLGKTIYLWSMDLKSRKISANIELDFAECFLKTDKYLRKLQGHSKNISSVTFSPDGQTLASASANNTIRLWPLTNTETEVFYTDKVGIDSLAYSSNGDWLASASRDNTIRLWNLSKGKETDRMILRGHQDRITSIAFSPDGKVLASASRDRSIRFWHPSDPDAFKIIKGDWDSIKNITFSPDGKTLASSHADNIIRFWSLIDTATHSKPKRKIESSNNRINSIAFNPNGKTLASAHSDNIIRFWSLSNSANQIEPIRTIKNPKGLIKKITFSPDGNILAGANSFNTIMLWHLNDNTVLNDDVQSEPIILKGHNRTINSMVFSPDGKTLASASFDKTIRLWPFLDSPSDSRVINVVNGYIHSISFSSDGMTLASSSSDKKIRLWPLSKTKLIDMACQSVGRNFTLKEWQDITEESYRKTCENRSLDFDYLKDITEQKLRAGETEEALMQLKENLKDEGGSVVFLDKEANRIIADILFKIGQGTARKGDINEAIKTFEQALHYNSSLAFNPEQYAKSLFAPTLYDEGIAFAYEDNLKGAMAKLELAKKYAPARYDFEVTTKVYQVAAKALEAEGKELAKQNKIDLAIIRLKKAIKYNPALTIEPEKLAKQYASNTLILIGIKFTRAGEIKEAIKAFEEAKKIDNTKKIGVISWNSLCWRGSLEGFAKDVLFACNNAVNKAENDGGLRDSRGVARALTGDFDGAIKDFELYIKWGEQKGLRSATRIKQRKEWIKQLQENKNPFDNKELLTQLKGQ